MITVKHGNIFTSKCQTIVNTINCVGQMGAGIALEFKLRYPNMYKRYQALCKAELIKVGSLWLYKPEDERYGFARVLNFPTKVHWRAPSRFSYLVAGLDKFIATYQDKGIESIAFPLLGASKGGLEVAAVEKLMQSKLSMCDIPVEIWHFNEQASDDLFDQFKVRLLANNVETVRELTGLRRDKIQLLMQAVEQPNIRRLSALAALDGVGKGTLEKAFVLASGHKELNQSLSLF
jgi:O-acetyl-ADP-ribose deacetylase (regulator of RNase III)